MNVWLVESLDRMVLSGLTVLLQSAIILAVALCLCTAFRRRPAVRHATALTALVALAVCLILQFVTIGDRHLLHLNILATTDEATRTSPPPSAAPTAAMDARERDGSENSVPITGFRADAESARQNTVAAEPPGLKVTLPARQSTSNSRVKKERPSIASDSNKAPVQRTSAPEYSKDAAVTETAPMAQTIDRARLRKRFFRSSILLWMVGGLALAVRFLLHSRRLKDIISGCEIVSSRRIHHVMTDVASELCLCGCPVLLVSDMIPTPIVTGIVRPRIILPTRLAQRSSTVELHLMLTHECAHIARRDLWISLFQRWLAVVYWPNVLVHLLNRQLSLSREELCDNYVLASTSATDYARLLLHVNESATRAPTYLAALPWMNKRWSLEKRVAGLLLPSRNRETKAKGWTVWLSFCSVLSIAALAVGIAVADGPIPTRNDDPADEMQSSDVDLSDTAQVIDAVRAHSAFWIDPASPELTSLEYTYVLGQKSREVKLEKKGKSNDRYSAWQGCSLRTGLHAVLRDPDRFSIQLSRETDENKLRIVAKAKDSSRAVKIEAGNGIVGSWLGYYSHSANEIMLIIDSQRLLPLEEKSGQTTLRFLDWRQVGDDRWVPGTVDVMKGDIRYQMHFSWMGDAVWLLTHAENLSRGSTQTVAFTRDVIVNGQAITRPPSDGERREREGAAVLKRMLAHNRAWLSPGLHGIESVEYEFHTVREDVYEQAFVNKDDTAVFEVTRDGHGKMGDRLGDRKMALSDHATAYSHRGARFAKLVPRPTELENQPADEQLRHYARTGCQFDMPLFRHQDWFEHALITFKDGEWKGRSCEVVKVSGVGRNVYFGAGTMLAFTSWSYVQHIRPAYELIYIDSETHLPIHETLVNGKRDRTYEIDFSDYVEVEPGNWAPRSIDIEAKGYFNAEYRFQIVSGKHWILKEITSWFDPAVKSRGVLENLRLNQPSDLHAAAMQQVESSRQLFGGAPARQKLTVKTFPIVFGQRTKVGPYRVMLTLTGPWMTSAKVEAQDESVAGDFPMVLLDENGRPLFATNVTLHADGDVRHGEAKLGNSKVLGDVRSLLIPNLPHTSDSERAIDVIPCRWDEPIDVNIAGPDDDTRAYKIRLTTNDEGVSQAKVSVASQAGPAEFLLDLSVVLFDESGQIVSAGRKNGSLRVEHGLVETAYTVDFHPTAEPSQVKYLAIAVTPGDTISVPMGSVWGTFLREGPSIPLEQLLTADDDACRQFGLRQLGSRLDLDREYFGTLWHRTRLRERRGDRKHVLRPYVKDLVRIVQQADDATVLAHALLLLGHAGVQQQLDVVRQKLTHPNALVVDAASVASAMLGSPENFARLGAVLDRPQPSWDTEREARRMYDLIETDVLIALATIGDDRSVKLLGETLQRDLHSLSVSIDEKGRRYLEGRSDRAEHVASALGLSHNESAAVWLIDAAKFLVDHPELDALFDQDSLAESLLQNEKETHDFFASQIEHGNYAYVRALETDGRERESYLPAVRKMLLAADTTPGTGYQGVNYLWNVGSPEALEILRAVYAQEVFREDTRTRLRICEALAALGDDRGLRDAFEALTERFKTDDAPTNERRLKAWQRRKDNLADWTEGILERVSQSSIAEFAIAHVDALEPGERRAMVELLWYLPDTPEPILPALRSWQANADASLQKELTKLLEREDIRDISTSK